MTIKLGTNDLAGLASSNSDNISITHNSSNKLQTIGIINQKDATQSFKTWVGTKAEYDALETKNNDTIYNVTDDGNVNQSLLEMIYPIGSIYIGTMNICPLSALFGTWQLVGTKILTDIPVTLEAKGNGKTLGFTDGIKNFGLTTSGDAGNPIVPHTSLYDTNIGTPLGSGSASTVNASFGLTTDSTKSGIVVDTNATSLTVNIWKRIE